MKKQYKVLLLIETSYAYGRGLLAGITKYANQYGPWNFYLQPAGFIRFFPESKEWDIDGIIARIPTLKIAAKIFNSNTPTIAVALEELIPGCVNIIGNCQLIAQMAASHFLERGFKTLAYAGFSDMHWSRERCDSFVSAAVKKNCNVEVYNCSYSKFEKNWNKEQKLLIRWLKKLPKPCGLFACNDFYGLHITEAAKISGIYIPDELAILGVDNDRILCELSSPTLSSIGLNVNIAGYSAAELLHKMMQGKKNRKNNIIVNPTYITERQSTNIMATRDDEVIKALRFIRNSEKIIQVPNVMEHVSVSRRSLELKFKEELGHSINNEIMQARANLIAKMLIDSDFPISQIATKIGYADSAHISRFFRQYKNVTPEKYRQLHKV